MRALKQFCFLRTFFLFCAYNIIRQKCVLGALCARTVDDNSQNVYGSACMRIIANTTEIHEKGSFCTAKAKVIVMCSICGIADFIDSTRADGKQAEIMGRSMRHRGIDDDGLFVSEHAALQHNRLAVVDVENGKQPMSISYKDRIYTIVYNGEVYNCDELRQELAKHGITPRTHCDTELVLYSYIIFGDDCPNHLNGIFAFAVYDESKGRMFLARDRFGIKPLYYTLQNGTLLFASEIKALLKHPDVKPIIDMGGLWQLMFLSPVTINGSGIFRDISELKPANRAVFDKDGLQISQYWRLAAHDLSGITSKQAAEKTAFLMHDAVNRQLISDVPLCTFLSGGLDSSVITALAAENYKNNGKTLSTYSFEYEGNRESFHQTLFQPQGDDEYAVYLADWLGTNHTVLTAPTKDVADYLTKAVDYRDFPGQADIDSSLLYYCELVKRRHTVALSGECSDEIFGGYPWFYRPEMLYKDFFPWIHKPMFRINMFKDSIVKPKDGYEYISKIYRQSLDDCPVLESDSESMITSRKATWLSVNYFMTSLLERKDRMSMASSLEVRVPFADHRILEFVFNVPWEIKFENNVEKALLRNAMSDYLPDKILWRKKSPYPKTHNPKYLQTVEQMLDVRMKKDGFLSNCLNTEHYNSMINGDNETWFGQLMSKPQLIAWLIQLDYFFEKYNVKIEQ